MTGGTETENAPAANQANILTAIGSALNTGGGAVGAFGGTIDEVRIWNTARSQAQIQASMNTEQTSPTANLVGRWGLDEGTGSAIADSSGSGFNGTTVGGPTLGRRIQRDAAVGRCSERPAVRRLRTTT